MKYIIVGFAGMVIGFIILCFYVFITLTKKDIEDEDIEDEDIEDEIGYSDIKGRRDFASASCRRYDTVDVKDAELIK